MPSAVVRYREHLAVVERDLALLTEVRDSLVALVTACDETTADPAPVPRAPVRSEPLPEKKFPCPICNEPFRSERAMSGHKGRAHIAKDSAYRGPGTAGGRLPQHDWARGREMWDEGATIEAIATALGCPAFTVKSARQRYQWPKRATGAKPTWDVEKGKALWEADTPTLEIARQCQVDRKTVQATAIRQGWKPRGKGWRAPTQGKPINVRRESPAPKSAKGYMGRERIPLTKHASCGGLTTSSPCERCNLTVAIGERGVA
jgi:hypothetical protein